MSTYTGQLELFHTLSLNPTYEIKRQIRLAINNCGMSRDQIVDEMNKIASAEGMRRTVSKAALDNWAKDSDPFRMPTVPWLTIFCHVVGSTAPFDAAVNPLGNQVIDYDDVKKLEWARAEIIKRRATKKARLALEAIE